MSTPDRKAMLDHDRRDLSIRRQCVLLSLARSGVYRPQRPAHDDGDLTLRLDDARARGSMRCSWPGRSSARGG